MDYIIDWGETFYFFYYIYSVYTFLRPLVFIVLIYLRLKKDHSPDSKHSNMIHHFLKNILY